MADVQTSTSYEISVVIGTLNRPHILKFLLKQLVTNSKSISFEVLVFDQSSNENYKKTLAIFPKKNNFRLLRLEKPNTCKYLNEGWQQAKAPIVLYLDDDVELTSETLKNHLKQYLNPQIHGVAGRVINDGESVTTDSNVGRVFFSGAVITKNFSYTDTNFSDFPYGCNMSFRKKTLEAVGGFDEHLQPPIYAYNEVDLGVRVSKRWPESLIFSPDALVYHHRFPRGGTRSFEKKDLQKSIDFNYGYFLGKNFNLFQNIACVIRRMPFQLLREPLALPAIIKGYIYAKKINSLK